MIRGQLPKWKGLCKHLLGHRGHASHIPQSSLGWQHGILSPEGATASQCYSHHRPEKNKHIIYNDLGIIKSGTSVPSRHDWDAMVLFIMLQNITCQPEMLIRKNKLWNLLGRSQGFSVLSQTANSSFCFDCFDCLTDNVIWFHHDLT